MWSLLRALGFYMWPHTFGSALSARDERVFKRNAAVMPLYQLLIAFVFFVGFAAVLRVPRVMPTPRHHEVTIPGVSCRIHSTWMAPTS